MAGDDPRSALDEPLRFPVTHNCHIWPSRQMSSLLACRCPVRASKRRTRLRAASRRRMDLPGFSTQRPSRRGRRVQRVPGNLDASRAKIVTFNSCTSQVSPSSGLGPTLPTSMRRQWHSALNSDTSELVFLHLRLNSSKVVDYSVVYFPK